MHATATQHLDFDQAIEISDGTYWVGRREGVLLECNIFLRVFRQNGQPAVNLVVDPGPPSHLMALTQKIASAIGHVSKVNLLFINHQDPDVASNAGYLQKMNPRMSVLCSEDTWRLIRFYGLDAKRFFPTERYGGQGVVLSSGHRLRFVPTPYCHFRGATMLYDLETRILYTGDLFGGLSHTPDLWADERSWEGMKAFHQIYMPTQEALRLAVQNIRKLDPKPLILAPQHGALIQGKWIDHYLDRIEALPVGLNLFMDRQQKKNYLAAMNELLEELKGMVGEAPVLEAMRAFEGDNSHAKLITVAQHKVQDIKIDLGTAVDVFIRQLLKALPEQAGLIESAAIKAMMDHCIPLPENTIAMAQGEGMAAPEFFQ